MIEMGGSNRWIRAAKAGGPPAIITGGLGIAATGIAGQSIERSADPIANGVAQAIGLGQQFGPSLLLLGAALIFIIAFFAPGLFLDRRGR